MGHRAREVVIKLPKEVRIMDWWIYTNKEELCNKHFKNKTVAELGYNDILHIYNNENQ